MRVTSSTLLAFAALLLGTAQVPSGPFGLHKGMTKAELQSVAGPLKEDQPAIYSTTRVPRPHPSFEAYSLVATPAYGLCKIVAIGNTLDMNAFGTQLQEEFARIEEPLTQKYGTPNKMDFLQSGSIWGDPQDWSMALAKEERTLADYWTTSLSPEVNARDHLQAISLTAKALSNSRGYVVLSYEFDNASPCLEEVKRLKNAVF